MNNIHTALIIGLITRPHGIKGELCVQYYADSPLLLKAPTFLISPQEEIKEIKITSSRKAKDHFIISLDNCKNRDQAETFRDYEICIDPHVMRDFLNKHTPTAHKRRENSSSKEIPVSPASLEENSVFVYELLGLDVYQKSPEGKDIFLGKLTKVDFITGQEIWVILTDTNKEILFPAVPLFVDKILLEDNKVIINPPEGLIEIYLN